MNKSLLKIYGFMPFLCVAFLNAFVDLGHKIIIQNTIYKIYEGSTQLFLSAIINVLMLLPFILMLSPSGFLADRFPTKFSDENFSFLFCVFNTHCVL